MQTKNLAGIDIGTNTFRLLIALVTKNGLKEIHSERIITRLGEGISKTGSLKDEAVERGIKALKEFSKIISNYNVDATEAVATSALREAKNRNLFTKKIKDEIGLDIKIISEEEEARLTSLGIMMDITIPESRSIWMIDIGGGSTELIFTEGNKLLSIHSLDLGVVYLADKYMKEDPPAEIDIKRMDVEISQKVSTAKKLKKLFSEDTVFIGTAGTVTTLSAMANRLSSFEHDKVHNTDLSLESLQEIFETISKISTRQRAEIYPVLESPRLDIIVPGALILLKIMMTFGFKGVIVSDNGLREGIILDLYNRITKQTTID